MTIIHNLGFPRIGPKRELKYALESFWRGETDTETLTQQARSRFLQNLASQANLDYQPVGDFSLYDHVLDHTLMFNNVPSRFKADANTPLQSYFRMARGRAPHDSPEMQTTAGEMTKWFDTNYHYIVPEFDRDTTFSLNDKPLLKQIHQAREQAFNAKPVLIGPVTYLWLGKVKDDTDPLSLLNALLVQYQQLLENIARCGVEWVQIDEPVLATDLPATWQNAFNVAYQTLSQSRVKLLLTTYFGKLGNNVNLATQLPVAGLHVDAVRGRSDVEAVLRQMPATKVLSLGVIDGRNIWKTDLSATLDFLEPVAAQLNHRLWLAPSCSLLHVPVDLDNETAMEPELKSWLAFATQKLDELGVLSQALKHGRASVADALNKNQCALESRRASDRVHNRCVQQREASINRKDLQRQSEFSQRKAIQQAALKLPLYPTTTIGSFPQTSTIRDLRRQLRQSHIDEHDYRQAIKACIAECIEQQEQLGLDVLAHGEAERNDMVEYFGQLLGGFAFTESGWVQSYGSRCVKPPVIFGDVHGPKAMTVDWTCYAQSLTQKPLKGMLTGPVTMLNWSFVRDDQPHSTTCRQIALAIRDEVLALEQAGIKLIQIDEAALREGLPLRQDEWQEYLRWSVDAFRLAANGVSDTTQIHTHMCYADFNDIIHSIARLDADVISIETSRSEMALLDAFTHFDDPNDIGPGVYDIHSPNIPDTHSIVNLLQKAAEKLPQDKLWVNPDCGLKTRRWEEVIPALKNMVAAARQLRHRATA